VAKITPFEEYTAQYDDWFHRNHYAYQSELTAVKKLMPKTGRGIEIGVGTGRFAAPLGIHYGIEPSAKMKAVAEQRGVKVDIGTAEALPYHDAIFDFALMVTTICFLDDVGTAFKEARRVLTPGGYFIIGFVDKESPIGRMYRENKNNSVFYREADFYSTDEVVSHLKGAGFTGFTFLQTIFRPLDSITKIEPVKPGNGRGSFIVIRGQKREESAGGKKHETQCSRS